ncbi:hypothetical protein ACIF0M_02795 [Dorea amylophila]|uniref:Uncharacterized protein n=1 Tax=Dorea amylophila TaxID=2981789 RepID=A0ABW8AVR6_9FIRM
MGNSTGSMFYLFVIVIVLYIVGASIYQAFLWFRKWQEKKETKSSAWIMRRTKNRGIEIWQIL